MSLRNILEEIMSNYLTKKKSETFNKNSSMFQLINYKSKQVIMEIMSSLDDEIDLEVKASCGAGGWTKYPWIAIFNTKITDTIQEGVYIVYLFSEDMQRVYLTLNQGCTNLKKKLGTKLAREEMQKVRNQLREKYNIDEFAVDNDLIVGNKDYEEGCIFYKEYNIGNLPLETQIKEDLESLIKLYDSYYLDFISNKVTNSSQDGVYTNNDFIGSQKGVNYMLADISSYIHSKGYIYSYEELSNFYLSLKTKPFVILAGISGTGKSKLVKLFAEAVGATSDNNQYNLISVKPDWNDSTELLGYKNLNDEFISGKLTEIILDASKEENRNKPYFVCLDEMNLARVEYYLSEYLSLIETRAIKENGNVVTDLIFPKSLSLNEDLKNLTIPDNLYVIGTVNMDDTTFAFSRKVLDRANTIEFSNVNLELLSFKDSEITPYTATNDFLRTRFINIKDALNEDKEFTQNINEKIIEINNILKTGNKHFGYRVRDEIVFYMLENKLSDLLSEEEALDFQIMQKILPTISGSDLSIKNILIKLYNYCNPNNQIASDINYITEAEKGLDLAIYKKSAEKIIMMLRGYEDGFTSFWL